MNDCSKQNYVIVIRTAIKERSAPPGCCLVRQRVETAKALIQGFKAMIGAGKPSLEPTKGTDSCSKLDLGGRGRLK
jgi:hypothetical protein